MTERAQAQQIGVAYEFDTSYPTPEATRMALEDAAFARAVTAYRFWYPTISVDAMFQGNRAIGIHDNKTMGIASTGPRQIGFTLNSDTPYGMACLDLSHGPMVVEIPAGPYIGMMDDHNFRWIADLGIPGPNEGKGDTYLVIPPGYDAPIPDGYRPARSATVLVMLAVRVLPIGADIDKALSALREVKVYPLAAGEAERLDFRDITDADLDASPLQLEANLGFWQRLHEVLDAEPVIEEFRPMYGLLSALGIEPGKPFPTDEATCALLERAARTGRDQMLVSAFASDRPDRIAWPDRAWEWAGLVPDNGDFETPNGLDLEARDRWFAQAIVSSPAMFRRQAGKGSLYWLAVRDADGVFLDGAHSYTLDIPQPVPGTLFWSVTIYDAETRSQIQTDQDKAALRSMFELRDVDASAPIRLHFGPEAPAGAEDRWIKTVPGRGWFTYLRIYGPEQPAFDGTWKPADIHRAR
ncbi:DUF1254 domain-containing protein [Rhodococcus daqingensis]|uniref:DUF1254 domain-containing protein n=1 Tax=Rhodococcus daqingensis TaxID=2479363 RepID=A0ABW2S4M2_9NOCA